MPYNISQVYSCKWSEIQNIYCWQRGSCSLVSDSVSPCYCWENLNYGVIYIINFKYIAFLWTKVPSAWQKKSTADKMWMKDISVEETKTMKRTRSNINGEKYVR